MRRTHVPRLLAAATPFTIAAALVLPTAAHADATVKCNAQAGSDGTPGNEDDRLECGANAIATDAYSTAHGPNSTAVGGSSLASGSHSTALGESSEASRPRRCRGILKCELAH